MKIPFIPRLIFRILGRMQILMYRLPFFVTTLERCPICNGEAVFEFKNKCCDLDRCLNCGHVYFRKQPKDLILEMRYRDIVYWAMDRGAFGITEFNHGSQWDEWLNGRMAILKKTGIIDDTKKLKFYEMGCSEGVLLYELNRLGHQTSGCEMNKVVAEKAREVMGVDIKPGKFEDMDIPPESYDVVLAFHILEHTTNPHAVMEKVTRILNAEGSIIIEVPSDKKEFINIDHPHNFFEKSMEHLLSTYFQKVEVMETWYTHPEFGDEPVRSLTATGKYPKKGTHSTPSQGR